MLSLHTLGELGQIKVIAVPKCLNLNFTAYPNWFQTLTLKLKFFPSAAL